MQPFASVIMIGTNNFALAIAAILAGNALARNGCRKCVGGQALNFQDFTTLDTVKAYLDGTLGNCATGGQYDITNIVPTVCDPKYKDPVCKSWKLDLTVWRYCGNGPKVDFDRGKTSVGNIHGTWDKLELTCNPSVDCASKCYCSSCGC